MSAWLYILRLKSGALYVGSTTDLNGRIRDHLQGTASRTTRLDPPLNLIYKEHHPTNLLARRREAQIKKWSRAKKEVLIKGDYTALKLLARRKSD